MGDSFDVFCEIVNIQRFFGKCHFISKDWLALSQDNVSESSEILPVDCCFIELAVTIQLSALVWYKTDIIIKKYLVHYISQCHINDFVQNMLPFHIKWPCSNILRHHLKLACSKCHLFKIIKKIACSKWHLIKIIKKLACSWSNQNLKKISLFKMTSNLNRKS